jgi:4'-phosphopantetheinyl transferase
MTERGAADSATAAIWYVDVAASRELCCTIAAERGLWKSAGAERAANAQGLSEDERDLVAHVALRVVLSQYVGWDAASQPFHRSPAGKPSLAAQAVAFSLSHSGELAAFAIGPRQPVGIDIEMIRAPRLSAENRMRLMAAADGLAGSSLERGNDADRRLLDAWVRIEAAAKAIGCGVGALLGEIGARRGSGADGAEIERRAAVVRTRTGLQVAGLPSLPEGTTGAVAVQAGRGIAAPRWFPTERVGLDRLFPGD